MSVLAYVGLPGSGKSYTAVEQQIIPALRQGRVVVTNIPMLRPAVIRDFPAAEFLLREFPREAVEANPDSILEVCPNGCLVVLDEVWRFWPAGKKVDKIPEAFKSFLAEHRHRVDDAGNIMQIVLVTQDLGQIAAFARQQIEQTFVTVKLVMIGAFGKYRTDIYSGAAMGQTPPESRRLRQLFGSYRKEVYQYYVSHTLSQADSAGANERPVDRRGNILLRPAMLAAPFLIIGLVVFGWTHLHRAGGKLIGGGPASPEGRSVATPSGPPAAPGSFSPARRERPPQWWVSGVIKGLGGRLGDVAMLTDGERSIFVELRECRLTRFDFFCPTESGEFVSARSAVRPKPRGPLRVGESVAGSAGQGVKPAG